MLLIIYYKKISFFIDHGGDGEDTQPQEQNIQRIDHIYETSWAGNFYFTNGQILPLGGVVCSVHLYNHTTSILQHTSYIKQTDTSNCT